MTGLIAFVSPLIDVLRYGSARKIPVAVLGRLVKHLTREVCVIPYIFPLLVLILVPFEPGSFNCCELREPEAAYSVYFTAENRLLSLGTSYYLNELD